MLSIEGMDKLLKFIKGFQRAVALVCGVKRSVRHIKNRLYCRVVGHRLVNVKRARWVKDRGLI